MKLCKWRRGVSEPYSEQNLPQENLSCNYHRKSWELTRVRFGESVSVQQIPVREEKSCTSKCENRVLHVCVCMQFPFKTAGQQLYTIHKRFFFHAGKSLNAICKELQHNCTVIQQPYSTSHKPHRPVGYHFHVSTITCSGKRNRQRCLSKYGHYL